MVSEYVLSSFGIKYLWETWGRLWFYAIQDLRSLRRQKLSLKLRKALNHRRPALRFIYNNVEPTFNVNRFPLTFPLSSISYSFVNNWTLNLFSKDPPWTHTSKCARQAPSRKPLVLLGANPFWKIGNLESKKPCKWGLSKRDCRWG